MSRRQTFERGAPMGASFKAGLISVGQAIVDAQARHNARTTILLPNAVDLNLHWVEPHRGMPRGGYMGRIDGKDLPLGDTGFKTACKLIKSKPAYYEQFSDPNAFPQSFRNVIDNPDRKESGIMVRTGLSDNGINDEIAAILPPDYEVRDGHEQINDLANMLQEHVGEVRGMNIVEQGVGGEKLSYRFILGDNVVSGIDEDRGLFMMMAASMSELGMMSDITTLGLYRVVCTNGAIRADHKELVSEWAHRGRLEEYLANTAGAVRNMGYLSSQWGKAFSAMLNNPLTTEPEDLLIELGEKRLIAKKHFEAAQAQLVTGAPNTEYDFFNLLTRSAQDLPSVQSRLQAETASMRLFTEPGGLMEQIRIAGVSRARRQPAPLFGDGE